MRVLVTGGAGFIGSHVVEALLARGDEVVCLDNFSGERKRRNIAAVESHERYRLWETDVRDTTGVNNLFKTERPDKVIHLAAAAGVRRSVSYPGLFISTNVEGTVSVLEGAVRWETKQFIFASSSSVYGASTSVPFREDAPCDRPLSPYAATKIAGEMLCHTYHHLYGLPCVCLRLFTVYGPRGRPDMAPHLFTNALYHGSPITLYGEGTSRDYTYINDIVAGVVAALDAELPYEVINLGSAKPVTLDEFVHVVESLLEREAEVIRAPMQPGDVPCTHADISLAQKLLGYEPKVSIVEGMARFVEWYLRVVDR